MPVVDKYLRLPLQSITILRNDRQRRELKIDDTFKRSITQNGVINPIIVAEELDGTYTLIAGERRLMASHELGLPDIPVRLARELSNQELKIIELEENIKRLDLSWQDSVLAIAEIHKLYCEMDSGWTMGETAEACALSTGTISMYLTVASQMDDDRVSDSGTVREAFNLLQRRQQRAASDALQELLDAGEAEPELPLAPINEPSGGVLSIGEKKASPKTPPAKPINDVQNLSFLDWAPTYEGKKFNLIHCDFPYGVNLFSSNGLRTGPQRSQMGRDQGEAYNDDPELYNKLLQTLCANLDRLMSISGHLMFWLSADPMILWNTLETFRTQAPSLEFHKFPMIWHKSDNAGIAARPNYGPRHIYEICLLASRGQRQIVKLVSDHYSAPTDKSIHVSCKPEPMLKHFMSMLVDENTAILDPTCGSGSALRAAEALGASRLVGLEVNPEMAKMANAAIATARAKVRAAQALTTPRGEIRETSADAF